MTAALVAGTSLPLVLPSRQQATLSGVGAVQSLTKDHLGWAIVARGHDGRVVLVVEGGAAEVSYADAGVLHRLLLAALRGKEGGGSAVHPGLPQSAALPLPTPTLCSL